MSPFEHEHLRLARRLGWTDPRSATAGTAALARWGPTLASIYAAAAVRHPGVRAIVDDRGSVTYRQLERDSTALAKGLRSIGVPGGAHVGVLCSNHRGFVEATVATAKGGWPCVYLNTQFAAPQLREVIARERVRALICDADLLTVVEATGFDGSVVVADGDPGDRLGMVEVRARAGRRPLLPARPMQPILLTSGTTGTPKGARRSGRPSGLASAIGLLQRIPYAVGDVSVIPTPMFHAWGLTQMSVAATTASTVVALRRFSPDATFDAVEGERATVLAAVPIMLQRMLATERTVDASRLRIVASSGSALPARVATEWMDRFGDTLYNMYGSTEVGQATIATPDDLRAAPGTAGRAAPGSTVEIVDVDGDPVPQGVEGRIFVGNDAQFTEYTGGGGKERVRDLMSTGDVGYLDADGRLFVTGRADDMIVSGGENVFPLEVEEVLLGHAAIADVAVVGVPDEEFGRRLAAYVVRAPDGRLDEDGVRAIAAGELARYKVPRDVIFLDELPRNAAGKLVRQRLGE